MQDGIDYVPTDKQVVFGHQVASIAGAGPINGPIQAAVLGWLPVLLWCLAGGFFIGAVQDFSSMYASVRNKGSSIGVMAKWDRGSFCCSYTSFQCWSSQFSTSLWQRASEKTPVRGKRAACKEPDGHCLHYLRCSCLRNLPEVCKAKCDSEYNRPHCPPCGMHCHRISLHGALVIYKHLALSRFPVHPHCIGHTCAVQYLLQSRDYLNSYLLVAMITEQYRASLCPTSNEFPDIYRLHFRLRLHVPNSLYNSRMWRRIRFP